MWESIFELDYYVKENVVVYYTNFKIKPTISFTMFPNLEMFTNFVLM